MFEITKSLKFISFLVSVALVFSLYSATNDYYIQANEWGIKIDSKLLQKQGSIYTINFDHDHGEQIPNNLTLKINDKSGNSKIQQISIIGNNSISHKISVAASKIKEVFLQSPTEIKVKANGRILQTVNTSPPAFDFFKKAIPYFFSACRNLILLATITNTFDVWMPLLMFIETFICLGLWTHKAHIFTQIYIAIYNSKFDIFNLIRLLMSNEAIPVQNSYIAAYGFSDKFILNCSGEFLCLVGIIVISIVIKMSSLFTNSQRLREISSKIRPMWNGYFFWMSPRIVAMAGLSLRTATKNPTTLEILHLALAAFGILIVLIFFIFLVIQIRKVSAKLEYISQSRHQIGLVFRIDYMKEFQFDCLQYSMLYYPAMNIGRLIFAHLCIGFAPDFHYVQFGGVIAAQVFYLMIQISCSGYNTTRHKILNPIIDFLYVVYLLCFIGIGLIYGVGHLQLTVKLEIVAFTILIFMLFIHLLQTVFDINHFCQLEKQENEQFASSKDIKSNDTKNENDSKSQEMSVKKNAQKEEIKAEQINSQTSSDYNFAATKLSKKSMKVKKIKNGRFI